MSGWKWFVRDRAAYQEKDQTSKRKGLMVMTVHLPLTSGHGSTEDSDKVHTAYTWIKHERYWHIAAAGTELIAQIEEQQKRLRRK